MARNRSLNAPRLFPSALHQNRDGFKKCIIFRMLSKLNPAAVETGSFALGWNRDTRRRRGDAGWRELQRGVRLLALGRNGRKAALRHLTSPEGVVVISVQSPS